MSDPVKPVTPRERLPMSAKVFLCVAAAVAIALAVGALTSCSDPAAADKAIAEWQSKTVAAMKAEGVDPSTATEADFRRIGLEVAQQMAAEYAPAPAPEPAKDWWQVGLDLLGAAVPGFIGIKGGLIGIQALVATLRGKPTRATENLGTVLSPATTWSDTAKALSALALDTATPAVPKS